MMGNREEWLVRLFCRRMKKIFCQNIVETDVCCTSSEVSTVIDYTIYTLSYSNDKGEHWSAGFIVKKDTWNIVLELWSKNGEAIAYELYES